MDTNIDKMLAKLKSAADARTKRVRKMRQEGKTFAQIAQEMGISRQRVKQIADRANYAE